MESELVFRFGVSDGREDIKFRILVGVLLEDSPAPSGSLDVTCASERICASVFVTSVLITFWIGIAIEVGLGKFGADKDTEPLEKPGTFCVEVSSVIVRLSRCSSAFCHDIVNIGTENDNDRAEPKV